MGVDLQNQNQQYSIVAEQIAGDTVQENHDTVVNIKETVLS